MTVNYYALHYHMKNSGVKFVINNIFDAIKEYGDSKLFVIYDDTTETYNYESVQSIGLPEIGYNEKTYKSYVAFDKAAKELSEKIESVMKLEEPCVLHAHNVNLCKNTLLGRALYHLSHRNLDNLKILMQVHDFAEDGREHLLKHMQTCVEGATESEIMSVAYPQAKNITYSTINSRDQKILSKIGIKNVFFFPNNINSEVLEMEPKISGLSQALSAYAKKHGYVFDPDRRTLLSPIKIIERKNVVETLSVLEKLNAKKDEWQLLITLDAHSENDKAYAHAIKEHIKKKKLPVVIGFGYQIISPDANRTTKHPYTLRDLFDYVDAIITTSTKEGFGMSYLEAWICEKPVVSRKIPYIFKDFKKQGISIPSYKGITIKGKNLNQLSIKEQLKVYNSKEVLKQIKKIPQFLEKPSEKLIQKNKKAIKKHYSLDIYFTRLQNMIQHTKGCGHKKLSNKKTITYFKTLNS